VDSAAVRSLHHNGTDNLTIRAGSPWTLGPAAKHVHCCFNEEIVGMNRASWAGLAALILGIGLTSFTERTGAADAAGAGIPASADDYKKLVAQAADVAKKGIDEKGKKGLTKARGAAIMIAAYAQYADQGGPAGDRATVRDAAIKLADAIKANKLDDAKKQAGAIVDLKADPAAKPEAVAILKAAKGQPGEVMRLLNTPTVGGLGAELHFKKLTSIKKEIPAKELNEEFLNEAFLTAAMLSLLRDNPPAKNPKQFVKFAEDAQGFAVRLVEAIKKKDGVAANQSLYELTKSCTRCHDKYRD
jgi:hypothetical protein